MSSRARKRQRKAQKDGPEIGQPIHVPPNNKEMGTKHGTTTMLIRNPKKPQTTGDN